MEPWGSHQNQGTIENTNRIISDVSRAMLLNLEDHLG